MKKKLFFAAAVILVLIGCSVAAADDALLPEIEGWACGEVQVIHLDTVSGNQGFWVRRNYISAQNVPMAANLMGGKGPGPLCLPAGSVDAIDGPIGSGAKYETVSIAGHRGILERDPTIGFALSVQLDKGVLTLESRAFDLERGRFLEEAGRFLAAM